MTRTRWIAIIALVFVGAAGLALAQGPRRDVGSDIPLPPLSDEARRESDLGADDRFALSIDVDLVNVDVVVTDTRDNPISGLQREHFRVLVDGVEQTVSNFSPTEAPLTVVLLIEFGDTFTYYYDNVITPAWGFVRSLRDEDWGALISYDIRPQIVTDFTRNKNELLGGLQTLQIPGFRETAFYDAVLFTLERMANIQGKKAVVLISSGFNTLSRNTYGDMLKMAESSDTMIYSLGMGQLFFAFNEGALDPFERMAFLQARNALQSLSDLTGGTAFFPRFEGEYRGIYETISVHLRNQYSLGFIPTNQEPGSKLRERRVEVPALDVNGDGRPDRLRVKHKKGFYITE